VKNQRLQVILAYPDRLSDIGHPVGDQSEQKAIFP